MILEAQKLLWFSPAHSHFIISNVNGTELLHIGVYHTVLVAIRSSQRVRQRFCTIIIGLGRPRRPVEPLAEHSNDMKLQARALCAIH